MKDMARKKTTVVKKAVSPFANISSYLYLDNSTGNKQHDKYHNEEQSPRSSD